MYDDIPGCLTVLQQPRIASVSALGVLAVIFAAVAVWAAVPFVWAVAAVMLVLAAVCAGCAYACFRYVPDRIEPEKRERIDENKY